MNSEIAAGSTWASTNYEPSKYLYEVKEVSSKGLVSYFCVQFPMAKFKLESETFLRRFKPA